jgi:hypothetical protein
MSAGQHPFVVILDTAKQNRKDGCYTIAILGTCDAWDVEFHLVSKTIRAQQSFIL